MAIAALLLWMGTVAVGSYLLVTATRSPGTPSPAPEPVSLPVPAPAPVPAGKKPDRNRFDPPSLQRAKAEPMPGLKELAEFTHPALAVIGLGFWLGYMLSHHRIFAAISLGILLGAICAGVSLFTVNSRAARRAPAAAGDPGTRAPGRAPLSFAPRLLVLHAAGAALTVLFAALIAARV